MYWPPISSHCILACRDTLAAARCTQFSGGHPDPEAAAEIDTPAGVSVRVWSSTPALVREVDAQHMPGLHAQALQSAWADGAWDLRVSLLPPLAGPELGLLTAFRDWSGAPDPLLPALIRAAGGGRLAMWAWRPMRGAPLIRHKQTRRDMTLDADYGRPGSPPARAEPNWAWRKSRDWVIRLGAAEGTPAGRRERRATPRQRACIVALRRVTGREVGAPLPAKLTLAEASVMIDRLRKIDGAT